MLALWLPTNGRLDIKFLRFFREIAVLCTTTESLGGMIGYGLDNVAHYRHAAYFVDRLLKGAHVADLPIE